MPPEQVKGEVERIGVASDVYSLGVILFQLLTGKLPFTGTTGAVMSKVLHSDAPPPSGVLNTLPSALDRVCLKAMAKKPEDRYPSMKAFAAELDKLTRLPAILAAPTTDAGEGTGTLPTSESTNPTVPANQRKWRNPGSGRWQQAPERDSNLLAWLLVGLLLIVVVATASLAVWLWLSDPRAGEKTDPPAPRVLACMDARNVLPCRGAETESVRET
jgi:serine/threonine-protein kinase